MQVFRLRNILGAESVLQRGLGLGRLTVWFLLVALICGFINTITHPGTNMKLVRSYGFRIRWCRWLVILVDRSAAESYGRGVEAYVGD